MGLFIEKRYVEVTMADDKSIKALQGKLFKVSLESMLGSTGIGWCLTALPKGIALLSEESILKTARLVGPIDQVFNFCALDDVGKVEIEFRLIAHRATIGKEEQSETVTVSVEVVPYNEKGDVSKARFVEYSENSATYGGEAAGDDDCTQVLKYGYPPFVKYGYPVAGKGCGHPHSHVVKYGYPPLNPSCEVYADESGCPVVKYGYPGVVSQTVKPYGYPVGQDAPPCPPVSDSNGGILYKYGYPHTWVKYGYPPPNPSCEVYADESGCPVVKYGYPGVKYGYPNSGRVKYGYPPPNPSCEVYADDCGCPVVKYGYPGVKYGYPNSGRVKYGYPPPNPTCEVYTDDCGCPVVKYGYPANR
jgi:hypothetical protein